MKRVLLVGLAASAGCKESRWIDVRATQIHVGRWVAEIPAGWRDIHELRTPLQGAGVPGGRTLVTEKLDAYGQINGQVDVFPFVPVRDDEGCQAVAKVIEEAGAAQGVKTGRVQAATFAGDKGCMMDIDLGTASAHSGNLYTRTHGVSDAIAVRCLGYGTEVDYACDTIIYGLRLE